VWRRKFPKRLSNKLARNTSKAAVDVSDHEAVICLLFVLAMIVLAYQNCPHDVLKVIVSLCPVFYYLLNDPSLQSFQSYLLSHQLQHQTVVQEAVQQQVEHPQDVATATIVDWHVVTDAIAERHRQRNGQLWTVAGNRKASTSVANRG
jgi:hypothetical protein